MKYILTICLMFISATTFAVTDTIKYYWSNYDTWISGANQTTNYGNNTSMEILNGASGRYFIVQFPDVTDSISADSQVIVKVVWSIMPYIVGLTNPDLYMLPICGVQSSGETYFTYADWKLTDSEWTTAGALSTCTECTESAHGDGSGCDRQSGNHVLYHDNTFEPDVRANVESVDTAWFNAVLRGDKGCRWLLGRSNISSSNMTIRSSEYGTGSNTWKYDPYWLIIFAPARTKDYVYQYIKGPDGGFQIKGPNTSVLKGP